MQRGAHSRCSVNTGGRTGGSAPCPGTGKPSHSGSVGLLPPLLHEESGMKAWGTLALSCPAANGSLVAQQNVTSARGRSSPAFTGRAACFSWADPEFGLQRGGLSWAGGGQALRRISESIFGRGKQRADPGRDTGSEVTRQKPGRGLGAGGWGGKEDSDTSPAAVVLRVTRSLQPKARVKSSGPCPQKRRF